MKPCAALAACLLTLLVAGCASDAGGGADTKADSFGLERLSFKETIASGLRQAGFEADQGVGFEVRVYEGPDWIDLDLEASLARYREDPAAEEAIVAELVDEAGRRLEEGIGEEPLDDARADLMPLLKPAFEIRTYGFEPAVTPFPGGLSVLYAVDRDDSFTVVQPADVDRWGTTVEDLHGVALANLERQTDEEERLLCEPVGDAELCGWASGDTYDATRMIVPGLREQIVRQYEGEAVYAVPMQNVFVALPLALFEGRREELFRLKVERDFQTADAPLSPEIFVERRGELVVSR